MEVEVSLDVMDEKVKCEKLEKVVIDVDEDKYFQIGVQLPLQGRERGVASFPSKKCGCLCLELL